MSFRYRFHDAKATVMRKNIQVVSMIWLSVLFLIGCGQDETISPDKKKTGPVPVTLQLQWVTQAQFAGYYVALEKGWYNEVGLDVTIQQGGPDIVPVELVSDGTVDFGTALLADLVVWVQKGKPLKSLIQIQQNNGLRLIAKKESKVKGPQDFIGKKVGVWLGGWEVQFNALMAQKNIDQARIDVHSQGFSMRPFLDGRLDVASVMIYNEYFMVLKAGVKKEDLVIIDYADYNLDFPGDNLFTSHKMLNEHPDICKKMVQASLRGWAHAISHQEEAVDIVIKYDTSGVIDRDHQIKMMDQISKLIKSVGNTSIGHVDDAAFKKMIFYLVKYQQLTSAVPLEKVYTSQFID